NLKMEEISFCCNKPVLTAAFFICAPDNFTRFPASGETGVSWPFLLSPHEENNNRNMEIQMISFIFKSFIYC
ncbi:MAG TPA: hypothetical protein DIC22_06350, partial [Chitinophagaceae bacterium]|nr:hypothetical protein [Chitinophagaceae bacterium]